MDIHESLQLLLFGVSLLVTIPLLGTYMAIIFKEQSTLSLPILTALEKSIYRACHIQENQEMSWQDYAKAMLLFNALGLVFLFILQELQGWLPLNPQHLPSVEQGLAFNTAISFVTNTNWQAYGGEITMSYLTQMLGLNGQNFLSAATGNAILLALIRGLYRRSAQTIGNFWVDLTRTTVYLFLPLCFGLTLILISQGVIQNFNAYQPIETLTGQTQLLPMGPVASQVAIKQLGSNGGGFFNANGAHPFENPTPLSNFLQTLAIVCIPAAATYMYGLLVGSKRQGLVLCCVMLILWAAGLFSALVAEMSSNPVLGANPVLEGKETRFGIASSVLWAVTTTSTSNGSINAILSSLSPLTGGVALFNLMIGEVIFGGVGVGLCSLLMFAFLTVFLAGLMIGRTPEYLGKKIEKQEMQWAMLALLMPCALILIGTSIATLLPQALQSISQAGPHGLSEILYAFSSAAANNGSSFGGLNANTDFYNWTLGCVMLIARMSILIPSLAIAGSFAQKPTLAKSSGTFATDTPLFAILLISVIFIVGALTFFPALCLGPIVEHLLMRQEQAF